jgi:tetratricopeptide (TPR) repeat protein
MLACQEEDYESALIYSRQGLDAARAAGDQTLTSYAWMGRGRAQEGLGRLQAAADTYEQVLGLRLKGGPLSLIIEVRAGLARIALAEGNLQEAMEQVNSFADMLIQPGDDGHVLDGTEEPLRIYYTTYHVLRAANGERSSMFQEAAVALLKSRASQIADRDLRKSYLRNVVVHRQIMGDLAASYA